MHLFVNVFDFDLQPLKSVLKPAAMEDGQSGRENRRNAKPLKSVLEPDATEDRQSGRENRRNAKALTSLLESYSAAVHPAAVSQ